MERSPSEWNSFFQLYHFLPCFAIDPAVRRDGYFLNVMNFERRSVRRENGEGREKNEFCCRKVVFRTLFSVKRPSNRWKTAALKKAKMSFCPLQLKKGTAIL